jgi:hypothetical protein
MRHDLVNIESIFGWMKLHISCCCMHMLTEQQVQVQHATCSFAVIMLRLGVAAAGAACPWSLAVNVKSDLDTWP